MAFGGRSDDVWASLPDPVCLRENETWSSSRVSLGDRNSGPVDGCATGPFSFAARLPNCIGLASSCLDREKQVLLAQLSNFFLSEILNVKFRSWEFN
jgi:hypothetical protein